MNITAIQSLRANYKKLTLTALIISGLLLSGCASVDRCPLSDTQKGLGACSSIEDSYNASSHSNGDGFSVFDQGNSTKNANKTINEYGGKGGASPLYFKASLEDNKGHYVYQPAVILKTWVAPYVNQNTQDLVNAHSVFWKAKEGGWDVPVSYDSGSVSDVFTPAVVGA